MAKKRNGAKTLIELIKADPEIKYLYEINPDRHLVEVPIARLEIHKKKLKQARDGDPENVDLLKSSLERTGGEPLYPLIVYPEKQNDGSVILYVVDGNQRLRAVKAEGAKTMIVQIFTIWKSIDQAFDISISANFARYKVGEADVFSILSVDPYYGKDKLVAITGFSASKVERLVEISQHKKLIPLVKQKLVGPATMVKLIKACKSSPEKLEALTNALVAKAADAIAQSKRWKNKIRVNKHTKYDRREKAMQHPEFYFKGVDWDSWENALSDDNVDESKYFTKTKEDQYLLVLDKSTSAKKVVNIRIGSEAEWEKEIAIFGLSGTKIEEINPSQLREEILGHWSELYDKLTDICDDLEESSNKKKKSRRRDQSKSEDRNKAPVDQTTDNLKVVRNDETE